MNELKTIVVFGSTGNCGVKTIEYFLNKGVKIYGFARREGSVNHSNYIHTKGDIQDWDSFSGLPQNPDLIINFAGVQPSILQTSEKTDLFGTLETYIDVNIRGILNVLRYAFECKSSTYIYTTTHREYENYWMERLPLENNMPQAINYKGDHTMYAISKLAGRMMGDYFSEAFNIRVFNLRLPMIFMIPDEPFYLANGEKRIMPFLKIIRDAIQGKDLEIWGDPEMPRDYVSIDNLINLIELCYRSDLSHGTFNVGTGEAVTTDHFVKTIGDVFAPEGVKLNFIYKPMNNTYKSAVYDVSEHKQKLGYQPVLLKQMLEKMKSELKDRQLIEKWGWVKG